MTVTRVPYPISAQYCENWGVVEALREIAANMLDARASYSCFHEAQHGVFTDFGPGFEPHCLMLGEGEAKNGEQIGQFKEGLKLALLVLARKKKKVYLETTGFTILRAEMEMLELGRPGLVLYIETGENRPHRRGTKVIVDCSAQDFKAATGMFLNLRVQGDERPTIDSTIFDPLTKKGAIYVNGLLTETSELGWSYNFHGEEIKGSMNRDRTVLNSWEVQRKVIGAWAEIKDISQIVKFLQRTKEKKGCRENQLFSNTGHYGLDHDLWKRALMVYLGEPENMADKLVFQDPTDKMNREAKELGYIVLSTSRLSVAAQSIFSNCVSSAGKVVMASIVRAQRRKKKKGRVNFGVYDVVPWSDIDQDVLYKMNLAGSIAIAAMKAVNKSVRVAGEGRSVSYKELDQIDFFVYDKDTLRPDSRGVWYKNNIGLSLDLLQNHDIGSIAGTIIHEFAHGVSDADDCTREFERILTDFCGTLAAGKIDDKVSDFYDLTKSGKSSKRVAQAELKCDSRPISCETLVQACEMMDVDGIRVVDRGHQKSQEKASGFDWHYLGCIYDMARTQARTKRSSSVTYIFRALTKNNRQIEMDVECLWTIAKKTDLKIRISYLYNSRDIDRYHRYRGSDRWDVHDWQVLPLEDAWPELAKAAGWAEVAAADLKIGVDMGVPGTDKSVTTVVKKERLDGEQLLRD